MAIIDAQVHAYQKNHPDRPWRRRIPGPDSVTGDVHVAAMDEVGVDGAVLVSPWSLYGFDVSYAVQVRDAFPGRFALVAPVDPSVAGVGERITDWAAVPGAIGVRFILEPADGFRADDPAVSAAVGAAQRHNLPICVFSPNTLSLVHELAGRYPDARFVVDHVGLPQPFTPPPPADPFGRLPDVLGLARHPNVAIKITGACTLSHRPFPFDDLWPPLGRIFDAFGIDRCMWGTDWTRSYVSYRDSVDAFRMTESLTAAERDALMGGTLGRIFRWSPSR